MEGSPRRLWKCASLQPRAVGLGPRQLGQAPMFQSSPGDCSARPARGKPPGSPRQASRGGWGPTARLPVDTAAHIPTAMRARRHSRGWSSPRPWLRKQCTGAEIKPGYDQPKMSSIYTIGGDRDFPLPFNSKGPVVLGFSGRNKGESREAPVCAPWVCAAWVQSSPSAPVNSRPQAHLPQMDARGRPGGKAGVWSNQCGGRGHR